MPVLAVARLPRWQADPRAPDGFLVYSHCDDAWRDCRDHVRARVEFDGERAVPGRVSRPGDGDRVAADHVAAKGASCGAQVDHGALPERSRRLACQSAMR